MREIYAVVRRQRARAMREELRRSGCRGYTVFPALGRGRQRGVRSAAGGHGFLPRLLFYLVVEAREVPEIVEAIIRANQTGEFGDGRIFVMPAQGARRVSTSPTSVRREEVEVVS